MRAAEKLIAEQGIENVSIRGIVSAAKQKNESALQYHFKNLTGLFEAIRTARGNETQAKREELLQRLHETTSSPSLRQICTLMVQPAYDLASGSLGFRRYIKAFGHELMLSESSALSKMSGEPRGGPSGEKISQLLQQALPHLDAATYRTRMEAAVRLCSASMYFQARQKNAFRGTQADLFFHQLIDAVVGILSAPVSPETKALQKGPGKG